jgi:hypothetical protein
MRGFVGGSMVLIVMYVVLQPGSTERLVAGNNALMNAFRRALSGEVPAIPKKKKKNLLQQIVPGTNTGTTQSHTYTV